MNHILDNPIYNALTSGNACFSNGNERAMYFTTDIAPFAGMKENSAEDFAILDSVSPAESTFVIFTPQLTIVPAPWKVVREMQLVQMIWKGEVQPATPEQGIVDLDEQHVPEMLALTQLTNPGPFLQRTIEFGNYTGVFSGGRLVAMAGQRQQPLPYIEISAVCTHPDHLGKGYASLLLREQIRRITAASFIPFLHARSDNYSAISVYERLGFKTRKGMTAYVFQKA